MLRTLTLNAKIYLTLLISGIVVLMLIALSLMRMQETSRSLDRLNRSATEVQNYITITAKIETLKRHVLNYSLSGDRDAAQSVQTLQKEITADLNRSQSSETETFAETLSQLRLHFQSYNEAFRSMLRQRPVQTHLRADLRARATKAETLVAALQSERLPIQTNITLTRLLTELLEIEKGAVRYFETYDRNHADAALASVSAAQDLFDLLQRQQHMASQLESLAEAFEAYRQTVVTALQHFRAYLMLDVVMSGEANEMLHYAAILREEALSQSREISEQLRVYTRQNSQTLLWSAGLFILAMGITSWFLIRIVVTPLRQITATFSSLIRGDEKIPILAYDLDDDIGQLVHAAKAFQAKNIEIGKLLEHSETLTRQLQLSEHRLRVASESGQIGVWELDLVSNSLIWDTTMFSLYGVSPGRFHSDYEAWRNTVRPDALPEAEAALQDSIAKRTRFECRFPIIRQNDGEERIIQAYADTLYAKDGTSQRMIGVNFDITESERLKHHLTEQVALEVKKQREQEQVLIQQSKLAAMGEMISAIAHQWRQPLNAIALYLQDLISAERSGELDRAYLKESVDKGMAQVNHMSQTIEDFRNFFRPSSGSESFDLVKASQEASGLFGAQLKSNNISLQLLQEPVTLHEIYGNPNHLRQVLLNLLSNAIDAIKERKEKDPQHSGTIVLRLEETEERFIISVEDNGTGISTEAKKRLFEPYFSTKEQGKGSGIGLYMSRTILQNYFHASLELQQTPEGTRALITIPKNTAEPEKESIDA